MIRIKQQTAEEVKSAPRGNARDGTEQERKSEGGRAGHAYFHVEPVKGGG